MPEENESPTPPAEVEPDTFAPITSQDDLDKVLGKRLERERSKFADYEELREKATKFDEDAEQSKTELQRAIERAEQAEKRATENEHAALRTRIASEMGVPAGSLTGADEESLKASGQELLDWRESKKKPAPSPRSLTSGSSEPERSGEKGRAAAALRAMRQG